MTEFDPVAYINEPRWRSSRLGLERIAELMHALGDPQDRLRIVHVAGTNGKGSTCAFTAQILQQAGFKTGLFSSPYIMEFADRIRVDGENILSDDLLEVTRDVARVADEMDDHPTEFELMTAVALLHFARSECEFAVVEVGLGGRLDSTNVIAHPEVCAIAPISFDHTALLGTTLEAIAGEKAGIIKPGVPVASAAQPPEAAQVIRDACKRCKSDIRFVDDDALSGTPADFSYKGYEHLRIGLLGSYQVQNAALAIEIIECLREAGVRIDDETLRSGLEAAQWPGRFEIVSQNPTFVIDGGHNPQGARALVDSLALNFPGKKVVYIIGVLKDKDYPEMLETVLPSGSAFICIEPPNPRALTAYQMARAIRWTGQDIIGCTACVRPYEAKSIPDAVAHARDVAGPDGIVCAFGSLYSIHDIMEALREQDALS